MNTSQSNNKFMQVRIITDKSVYVQTDVIRVLTQVSSGLIEIYNGHQDLIGSIVSGFLEVRFTKDNKIENKYFAVRDGVIVVTNGNIVGSQGDEYDQTRINVFASKLKEIGTDFPVAKMQKELDKKIEKSQKLEEEINQIMDKNPEKSTQKLEDKLMLLFEEIDFLKSCIDLHKKRFE